MGLPPCVAGRRLKDPSAGDSGDGCQVCGCAARASRYSDGDEIVERGIVSVKRGELRVMRSSPFFLVERQKPTRTLYPDNGKRLREARMGGSSPGVTNRPGG